MDLTSLEARVATLEHSLRRSRLTTAALALGALIAVGSAFVQQPPAPPEAQAQALEQLVTQRLVLTSDLNAELVVLQGGADGSLVVLTPDGREVVRLGGPAARRIGH